MKTCIMKFDCIRFAFAPSFFMSLAMPALSLAADPVINGNAKVTYSKAVEGDVTIDTDQLYKANNNFYFRVKNIDQSILQEKLVPIVEMDGVHVLNPQDSNAALTHPAVADKIQMEASLMAYDQFTAITKSILSGKIPRASIVGETGKLIETTPRSLLLADNNQDIDYLDQDQEAEPQGYIDSVKQGAQVFIHGDWFAVVGVNGHFFDQKSTKLMKGFNSSGYGVDFGLMRVVESNWLLGIYGGYQKLKADLKDHYGEVESGSWRLGPTLAFNYSNFTLEGLVTYNWHSIDSKIGSYKADYKNNGWEAYIRGGYDINLNQFVHGLTVTPEAQFLYLHKERDAFNWSAGMVEKAKAKGWVSRLGGSILYQCPQLKHAIDLKASIGWQHNDFKNDNIHFMGTPVTYGQYDENAAYYSIGLESRLSETLNMNVGYSGTWSENALGHFVKADIEFRF